jgi:hypothetical protein
VTPAGGHARALVEPLTNYAVARVIRDFRAGESAIGVMGTGTNRRLDDSSLTFLRDAAYTGGVTARHRWSRGRYLASAWLAGSHITGDTSAIRIAQTSSARYFQRPEIAQRFDPTRTALSGWAGALDLMKVGGGHWRYGSLTRVRSPGFEINDVGFQTWADQIIQAAFLGYDQYRPSARFQSWRVNGAAWTGWSFAGERVATGMNVNGGFQRPSYRGLSMGLNREWSALSPHALRGGPALRTPGTTSFWAQAYSDQRNRVSGSLNVNLTGEDETGARRVGVSPSVRMRPSTVMEVSLGPSFGRNTTPWQYVTRRTVSGQPVYVFGELDQTTTSLVARANYTFTPDLSFQLYAQPFMSAGRYGAFREVADPKARDFSRRFRIYPATQVGFDAGDNQYEVDRDGNGATDFSFENPDFSVKRLRGNAVLRWEYRPGSTVFVVWSQGRAQSDRFGDFDLRRDAADLLAIPPTNVLLVKLNYWLGW